MLSESYKKGMLNNLDKLDYKFMVVINNKTMRKSYRILSNMYCDPFYTVDKWLSTGDYSAKSYRKTISQIKEITGKSVRLVETNNDVYYTRLIYKLV